MSTEGNSGSKSMEEVLRKMLKTQPKKKVGKKASRKKKPAK